MECDVHMTSEPQYPEPAERVPAWLRPLRIIREHIHAYLILNAAAYGLTIIGLVIGLVFPALTAARSATMEDDGTGDLVRGLVSTPLLFALTILTVNLVRLSLLTIVLPSLIVPFAGLVLFSYWAVQTGITLAPDGPDGWVVLIPHCLTVVIELQAYVLLLLGAYLLGRYWLVPGAAATTTRRGGYSRGLHQIRVLALPALILLIVGAMWEAYSLRYLVHPLGQLLL